jgi:hypothetical protein
VSFHTVLDDELIEERPDPDDPVSTRRKLYVGTNTDRLQDM